MNYIDIETAPAFKDLESCDQRTKDCWTAKMRGELTKIAHESSVKEVPDDVRLAMLYEEKAALYSEFNKIVCVSLGTVISKEGKQSIYIKSSSGDDEIEILKDVAKALDGKYELCAHNGVSFDFPLLVRKYLIYGLNVPDILLKAGQGRPWESPLVDTQLLWRFGDYRYTVSLDALAMVFNLPSPKANMHGSEVGNYYWSGRLREIVTYCELDVKTLINVHRKMIGLPIVTDIHGGEPEIQEELFN